MLFRNQFIFAVIPLNQKFKYPQKSSLIQFVYNPREFKIFLSYLPLLTCIVIGHNIEDELFKLFSLIKKKKIW